MTKNMEMLYLLFPIIGAFILLFIACCFGKKMKEILHIPKEVVLGRALPDSHRQASDDSDSDSDYEDGPRITISLRNMTPRFPPLPGAPPVFEEEVVPVTQESESGSALNNNNDQKMGRCKSSPCISKDGYMFVGGTDGCAYIPSQCVHSPARSVSQYLMSPYAVCANYSDSPHHSGLSGSVPADLSSCCSHQQSDINCHGSDTRGSHIDSGGSSSTECAYSTQKHYLGVVDVHVQMNSVDSLKVEKTGDDTTSCDDDASHHGNSDLPSMPSSDSGCDVRGQSFDTMNDVTEEEYSVCPQDDIPEAEELKEEPG